MLTGLLLAVATPLAAAGALAVWLDHHGGRAPVGGRWDVLVVAGCRVLPDGSPSPALDRRVRLAVTLFRAGFADRLLVTGGTALGAPRAEAAAAAELAVSLGVPPHAVLVEDRSRDTLENAAFARSVWEARAERGAPGTRVLVVTDRAHAYRCGRMFGRHFGHVAAVGATPPGGARLRMAVREVVSVVHHGVRGRL